jgi:polyisoprenoid-binding protein YceI
MIRITSIATAIVLAFGLVGCESEVDNKPAATVEAPKTEAPPVEPPKVEAPAAPAVSMMADPATSKLEWVAAKVTKDHPGGFSTFQASLDVADGKPTALKGTIELGSVFSDAEKLTAHLKEPDFFDVAQFAKATFESSALEPIAGAAPGAANTTVKGSLDLHGMKKDLSFPATITAVDGGMDLKAEFTINRKDWGLAYPGKPDDLIKDEVLIKLDLRHRGGAAAPSAAAPAADAAAPAAGATPAAGGAAAPAATPPAH